MRSEATGPSGLGGRAVAVVIAAALGLMAACGGGSEDGGGGGPIPRSDTSVATPTTGPGGGGVRPLRLLRDFLACVSTEADLEPFSGEIVGQLGRLRDLDPEDGTVRAAVRACFPALATAFADAGLRPPTQGELAGPGEPAPSRAPGAPVIDGDFADPFLHVEGDGGLVYATNTLGQNVPVARFDAAGSVSDRADALPELPPWTEPGTVWAPSDTEADGGYVLYYTTRDVASGLQCISVGVARDPLGPFVDDSEGPLVCQRDLGGSIDPSPYHDGERSWLVWKSDGNCCGIPTRIFVQRTSASGTELEGEPISLLGADAPWEGELVEGPALVDAGDDLLLFYSANRWDTADYAVGYAVCESVTGPCTKPQASPWLATYPLAAGPGGQELSTGPDGRRIVYHGWSPGAVGYDAGGVRRLYVEPVDLAIRPPALEFTP